MRVLWIKSDFPLPADTGGKIRTRHLLVELARRAEVTFLCYIPPGHDPKILEELRGFGINVEAIARHEENKQGLGFPMRVLSKLFSPRPYIVNKYITAEMIALLQKLANPANCDVVLCDFLEMAWCRDFVSEVPCVLFEHNVETMIWRRYFQVENNPIKKLYFGFEKERMARYEAGACGKFDHVLTVSTADAETLRREFGLTSHTVLPTGVDVEYFTPQAGEISGRLVFCGSMDWMPNIDGFQWFYRSIYPQVRKNFANATLSVVGRRPAEEILAVQRSDSSVLVSGTVEDVRPYVAAGQLYVVPLRVGGGTRIKIYEAMAMRKCVISTSIGAEGLPLVDGEHLVLADSENDFADRIKELLRDNNKRNTIAEAGYGLVTGNYGWGRAAELLHEALQSVKAKI